MDVKDSWGVLLAPSSSPGPLGLALGSFLGSLSIYHTFLCYILETVCCIAATSTITRATTIIRTHLKVA